MYTSPVELNLLIETSWEVCNKVGGIYTVLSTKAQNLQKLYKDKVIFLGPDIWTDENPSPYFKETKSLLKDWQRKLTLPDGVSVRVGRWEIPGRPVTVLVKYDGMYALKNNFYALMWQLYGVDSLHAYGDYDESCAFSHAAGIVAESLINFYVPDCRNVIAHFDEWTTGMGLLYIKSRLPRVATVFTTHATSIGRSICGNNKPLYDYLHAYNGDQMAGELNMQSKHSLEKAAAHQADCFTTVSDITADECAQLLERRPDVVTPNGFEKRFTSAGKGYAAARNKARAVMLRVARALTGTEFPDNTFIVATSGRCEYRNKGIDLYLDAINRLGDFDPARKVLAFVMVPAWVMDARPDLAHAIILNEDNRLVDPVITHRVNNPDDDRVLGRIRQLGFSNSDDSRVSIIYVPCYLNGDDGIFNIPYYGLLPGMDATVFASYYEPWGYTPLESIAFGVPTVTTSLSGFGRWVMSLDDNTFDHTGVAVESRTDSNYSAVKEAIALQLKALVNAPAKQTKTLREAAVHTADLADWSHFIDHYVDAYGTALKNCSRRLKD